MVTPTLQTSQRLISFIFTPFNIYGAMYWGVPAKVTLLSASTIWVARPKSAILIYLFLINMFAGFMSRCTKSFDVKQLQAEMICLEKLYISSSFLSKKCCWMYFSRSHSQYSKKRQRLFVVYSMSRNWTILGCFRLWRALYYSWTRLTKYLRLDCSTFSMSCFGITLQAQGQLQFLSLQALYVTANPPRPRHSSILMKQFPTFLFFYFILILQSRDSPQPFKEILIGINSPTHGIITQKLYIMTNHQQKNIFKNRLKSQRKYLVPLSIKNPIDTVVIKTEQKQMMKQKMENEQKRQQDKPINLNLFNEFFQRLGRCELRTNNRNRLPQISNKRSLSINITHQTKLQSVKKRTNLAKIKTESGHLSPWQDSQSNFKPIIIYEPLLGRRHTNVSKSVLHQSQIISINKFFQQNNEDSMIYYKHPLHEKCIKKQSTNSQMQEFVGKIKNQGQKITQHRIKAQNLKNNKKKVMKACNAIIFICYLQRYSKLYRGFRQKFMFQLNFQTLKSQICKFRQYLWIQFNDFTALLFEKRSVNFLITEKDTQTLTQKKIKYINIFLISLVNSLETAFEKLHQTKIMALIYHLCKHGSYSCGQYLLTQEELGLICISQSQGYIRCDKNLQKSSIISLLFIKIVLYSTLLKPHTMSQKPSLTNNQYFESNIKLIGNILYILVTKVQARLIQDSKYCSQVGNWRMLQTKFIIKTTQSMTIRQGVYQKQIISGLIKEKSIKQLYSNHEQNEVQTSLERIIGSIHAKISQFHKKIRIQCI